MERKTVMTNRRDLTLPILAGVALVGGCNTQPSQKSLFYHLDIPGEITAQQTAAVAIPITQPRLGVGPVTLANYLDRPQIVTRVSPYSLELQASTTGQASCRTT